MHYLTDYHDMPFTDAYYALEEGARYGRLAGDQAHGG